MSDERKAVEILLGLPEKFKAERQRRGMSLRRVAVEAGVPHASLHRFERGGGDPVLSNVIAIACWVANRSDHE